MCPVEHRFAACFSAGAGEGREEGAGGGGGAAIFPSALTN